MGRRTLNEESLEDNQGQKAEPQPILSVKDIFTEEECSKFFEKNQPVPMKVHSNNRFIMMQNGQNETEVKSTRSSREEREKRRKFHEQKYAKKQFAFDPSRYENHFLAQQKEQQMVPQSTQFPQTGIIELPEDLMPQMVGTTTFEDMIIPHFEALQPIPFDEKDTFPRTSHPIISCPSSSRAVEDVQEFFNDQTTGVLHPIFGEKDDLIVFDTSKVGKFEVKPRALTLIELPNTINTTPLDDVKDFFVPKETATPTSRALSTGSAVLAEAASSRTGSRLSGLATAILTSRVPSSGEPMSS
ncbi:unnamed protein product [Caenorhabditis auriculariae]|uniref:Uncharacterized protein n=1 Tax=Caenorhabditis auriculariae TaxID=2777116 RepID=A0A8S1HJZ8_9PELO|nr:unnamed protein product [Caenorhabditis auriculariae]